MRLPLAMYQKLWNKAEDKGLNLSSLMRMIITEWLKDN